MINVHHEIKTVKLSDISPMPHNPREISNEALAALRNSLQVFGLVDLLVVNKRTMRIIGGHQRYRILLQENVKEIPVIMVDLDDIREMLLNVTLNSPEVAGTFTTLIISIMDKIRIELPEEYLHLRIAELREQLAELETEITGKTLPDDVPEPPDEPITKPGDLWILGEHRLLCGDSTKHKDVERLMEGNKASIFVTDPPYCVDYTGNDRPTGGKDWSHVYHEVDIKDARQFMYDFYDVGLKHVQNNAALYLWHASRRVPMIYEVCYELDILIHQPIIWVKPCVVLTFSVYSWRHEPCFLMWQQGNKPHYRPSQKAIGSVWTIDYIRSGDPNAPEYYTDVWELDYDGKKRNQGNDHPTVKPTEVFAIPMRMHTAPGDICYEPFSGSGSQIIAAERTRRKCFAMEIEPIFCDVAVKRWEEFTGNEAKLVRDVA